MSLDQKMQEDALKWRTATAALGLEDVDPQVLGWLARFAQDLALATVYALPAAILSAVENDPDSSVGEFWADAIGPDWRP